MRRKRENKRRNEVCQGMTVRYICDMQRMDDDSFDKVRNKKQRRKQIIIRSLLRLTSLIWSDHHKDDGGKKKRRDDVAFWLLTEL
jgi:hypothetical protein